MGVKARRTGPFPNNVQLEEKEGANTPKKERRPEQLQASDRRFRKRKSSCREYRIGGKVVDFLLRSLDRVFTEVGIRFVSEQCGEKSGF